MTTHEANYKEEGVAKAEATSGERTEGGIHLGAEKYMKGDNPEDDPAYDPATGRQTGAGVPPTMTEIGDRNRAAGLEGSGKRESEEKGSAGIGYVDDPVTNRVVVPAPAPTAEHLLKNYGAGLYPGVEKREEERKIRVEEEAKEKEARKEAEKNGKHKHHRHRSTSPDRKSSVEKTKTVDHRDDGATAETKVTETEHHHDDDKHAEHEHHKDKEHHKHRDHHGIGHKVVHALHLDFGKRKEERERKEDEKEEIEERKERIAKESEERAIAAETAVDQAVQTEDPETAAPKKSDQAYEGGAVTDSKQTGTIPIDMLNPDGLRKKQEEEEALKEGGNYMDLDFREPVADTIPRDRIEHLVENEHRRREQGLPAEKEVSVENMKVAFHTADSFDKLDEAERKVGPQPGRSTQTDMPHSRRD